MDSLDERLRRLAETHPELAPELHSLCLLLGQDRGAALNKVRVVAERVLHGLCLRHEVSWGQREPTLECMLGPLTARSIVPRDVAIHLRTIQANASPGSHYQAVPLGDTHLRIAGEALVAVLGWYGGPGGGGAAAERPPEGAPEAAVPAAVPAPAPAPAAAPHRGRRRSLLLAVGGGLAIAAAAAVVVLLTGRPAQERAAAEVRALFRKEGGPAPRLLVVPFAGEPTRSADEVLWPLVDRMIVNQLDADERVLGRVRRLDPEAVAAEIEARELALPLTDAAVDELGVALGADVVLGGAVARNGAVVALDATLRRPGGGAGLRVRGAAEGTVAAARGLSLELRRALWGADAGGDGAAAQQALLVAHAASAAALLELDPAAPTAERRAALARLAGADRDSVGIAWLRSLDEPLRADLREDLVRRAQAGGHEDLVPFFAALSAPAKDADPCRGVATGALERRYATSIGPLVEVLCLDRRGRIPAAVDRALRASRDPALRPLVKGYIFTNASYQRSEAETVRVLERLQGLYPEHVPGWSKLAVWLARAGRKDEARHLLQAARGMLDGTRRTAHYVGLHGVQVTLQDLDVEGAREWADLMWTNRETESASPTEPAQATLLMAKMMALEGRFGESRQLLIDSLPLLAASSDADYGMGVTGAFYLLLSEGRFDDAAGLVADYERRFEAGSHPVAAYGAAVLRVALERARGGAEAAAAERLRSLGEAVVGTAGDRGSVDRAGHECLVRSRFGTPAQCGEIALGNRTSALVGGCRCRYAQHFEARGQHSEARAQYALGVAEIVAVRFPAYEDLLPACLLGLARTLEQEGDRPAAEQSYDRLTRNYARPDRELPEVAQARAALARLRLGRPGERARP